MKKSNSPRKVVDIINVIELQSGVIDNITSFPILSSHTEKKRQKIVKEAEDLLVQLAKENGDEDSEFTVGEGSFNDHNGYEVVLVWSHEI